MIVNELNDTTLKPEFGILCQRLDVDEEPVLAPFGSMWCVTESGGSSSPDEHPETEMVVVVRGQGTITVDSEAAELRPGTIVHVPPGARHAMRNEAREPLVTLSVYWLTGHAGSDASKDGGTSKEA